MKTQAQFWAATKKVGECLLWTAGRSRKYGALRWDNRSDLAHRVAWLLTRGDLPADCIVQTCGNTLCVAPEHLRNAPARAVRGPRVRSADSRFWEKVRKREGCWDWLGSKDHNGYGSFYVSPARGSILAHRFSYELASGRPTAPEVVMHSCDTPSCVNPAHLRLGTMKDNSEDMVSKGRSQRGERHAHAKLTEAGVRCIRLRAAAGEHRATLAAAYGISLSTVSVVIRRERWVHVA